MFGRIFCAVVAVVVSVATPSVAVELIINGDFETGTFAGWTADTTQLDPFQAGLNDGQNSDEIPGPIPSTVSWVVRDVAATYSNWDPADPILGYGAFNGFDGSPGYFYMRQPFTVAGDPVSAQLSFWYAVQSNYTGQSRIFTVNILDATATTQLATLYSHVQPTGTQTTWITTNVGSNVLGTLSVLGAGDYQLEVRVDIPQNFTGPAQFMVDEISLDVTVGVCGDGVQTIGEQCDDGNAMSGDCCSATCELEAATSPCDDGDACTSTDVCDGAGTCVSGAPLDCDDGSSCTADSCDSGLGCQNAPAVASGCLDWFQKGAFQVTEKALSREKLLAKFTKGPEIQQTEWGNPLEAGGTAYELCVFDDSENLVGSLHVDRADDLCDGKDCWKEIGKEPPNGKGYKFKDKGTTSDGTIAIKLKGGPTGKSQVLWKANNKNGVMPTGLAAALHAGVPEGGSATVQVHAIPGPLCVSMTLSDIKKNDGQVFKAKK